MEFQEALDKALFWHRIFDKELGGMAMLEMKAQAVASDMTGGAPAPTIVPLIIQIIMALIGGGGLGICPKPATGAQVKFRLRRSRRNRNRALDTASYYIDDPALAAGAVESMFSVMESSSDDEMMQLYQECQTTP